LNDSIYRYIDPKLRNRIDFALLLLESVEDDIRDIYYEKFNLEIKQDPKILKIMDKSSSLTTATVTLSVD
jgi:hypothetical protein